MMSKDTPNSQSDRDTPSQSDVIIELTSQVVRNEAIIFTDLDDTIVMMDVDAGQYYELDSVAKKIWTLCETARPAAEICDALATEYDVDLDVCRRDTLEFLQEASTLRLIHVQSDQA